MKTEEYIEAFISGKGKESIKVKKIFARAKRFIIVDSLDEADILLLPCEKNMTKESKADFLYAKELGIDVWFFNKERILKAGQKMLSINKDDISQEIEL